MVWTKACAKWPWIWTKACAKWPWHGKVNVCTRVKCIMDKWLHLPCSLDTLYLQRKRRMKEREWLTIGQLSSEWSLFNQINTGTYTRPATLGPKYMTQPGINKQGSLKLCKTRQHEACNGPSTTPWSSTLKPRFTNLYATMDSRSRAPGRTHTLMICCSTHVYPVERSFWPSLCHCSPPSLDPVCSTLCSNCHNSLHPRHVEGM